MHIRCRCLRDSSEALVESCKLYPGILESYGYEVFEKPSEIPQLIETYFTHSDTSDSRICWGKWVQDRLGSTICAKRSELSHFRFPARILCIKTIKKLVFDMSKFREISWKIMIFPSQNYGFGWFRVLLGGEISSKAAPEPTETMVLRAKIIFFQDISRNFDMSSTKKIL